MHFNWLIIINSILTILIIQIIHTICLSQLLCLQESASIEFNSLTRFILNPKKCFKCLIKILYGNWLSLIINFIDKRWRQPLAKFWHLNLILFANEHSIWQILHYLILLLNHRCQSFIRHKKILAIVYKKIIENIAGDLGYYTGYDRLVKEVIEVDFNVG